MLCITVPTVPHLYVLPLAAPRNDYLYEDFPDQDETNAPVRAPASASPIPSLPSRTPSSGPSPVANKSHTPPQKSIAGWDI